MEEGLGLDWYALQDAGTIELHASSASRACFCREKSDSDAGRKIPIPRKMLTCVHCGSDFANIRTARNHHKICPNVTDSDLECRGLTGCACDGCFSVPSERITFTEIAPLLKMPMVEGDSATSEAAIERATGYSKKAAKLFEGRKIFIVAEMSDSDADAAWEVMVKLQNSAENCCSMAAIQVNRNRSDTGLKRKPLKPLRFFFRFAIIA